MSGASAAAVAVDVGGSGLRVRVGDGEPLVGSGARVAPGGIDVGALVADTRRLLAVAGVEEVGSLVWAMRGLLSLADPAAVVAEVRRGLRPVRLAVVSDAVANLVGALGGVRSGAVVAAGTGAVAFGTDFAHRWRRADGWGHVLGDAGSGAWIGLAGLRAGLRSRDGLPGGSPALLEAGVDRLGPVEGWPRRVTTGGDAPELLASFAPCVTTAARTDPVAAGICTAAGRGLADALLAVGAGVGGDLTATGGVLASAPVADALAERLAEQDRSLVPPVGGALDGALLLARLQADDGLPRHPTYLLAD